MVYTRKTDEVFKYLDFIYLKEVEYRKSHGEKTDPSSMKEYMVFEGSTCWKCTSESCHYTVPRNIVRKWCYHNFDMFL